MDGPTIKLVFAGMRESTKGQLLQYWLQLTADEKDIESDSGRMFKNLEKYASIGDIYTYETEAENGKTYFKKGVRDGRWEEERTLTQWKAEDMATRAEFAARKKGKKDDALEKHLTWIRHAYQNMTGPAKAQFLAKIVQYIVKN